MLVYINLLGNTVKDDMVLELMELKKLGENIPDFLIEYVKGTAHDDFEHMSVSEAVDYVLTMC